MFTGLIADIGSVAELQRDAQGARLRIATPLAGQLREGDSIAVNGVCLTAADVREASFAAEAMGETLSRSSLGELQAGAPVNLELALRAADRLGGHVVQGHVDGTGTVAQIREDGFARVLEIEIDPRLERYLVEKGSVADRRRQPDRQRAARSRLRRVADPRDAAAHDARRASPRARA